MLDVSEQLHKHVLQTESFDDVGEDKSHTSHTAPAYRIRY